MQSERWKYKARIGTTLRLSLLLAILFQGIALASTTCCSGLTEATSTEITEHVDHGQHSESHSGGRLMVSQAGIKHECPPVGCDFCVGEDCVQGSSFHVDIYNDFAASIRFVNKARREAYSAYSARHSFSAPWQQPPSRAPPYFS